MLCLGLPTWTQHLWWKRDQKLLQCITLNGKTKWKVNQAPSWHNQRMSASPAERESNSWCSILHHPLCMSILSDAVCKKYSHLLSLFGMTVTSWRGEALCLNTSEAEQIINCCHPVNYPPAALSVFLKAVKSWLLFYWCHVWVQTRQGCRNLDVTATDLLDLSELFNNCRTCQSTWN